MHPVVPLLCSVNRIIRSRVLEILSVLFSWDSDPLQTLDLSESESTIDTAYEKILFISSTMIEQAVKMNDLMTAVSLLDSSLVLLERCTEHHTVPFDTLITLYSSCCTGNALLKSDRLKTNVLQLVLRSMNTLIVIRPDTLNDDRLMQVFHVLDEKVFYSDPRVLKSCLDLLTTCLYTMTKTEELLTQSLYSLVHVLTDDAVLLDCKSLVIVLQAFDTLLAHDEIGALVTESVKFPSSVLSSLMYLILLFLSQFLLD